MRVILAEVFRALPNQGLCPRLNVIGLEVPDFADRDAADSGIAEHVPETGEIGLADRGARRGSTEVRFAIGVTRDARSAIVHPLGRKGVTNVVNAAMVVKFH